VAGNNFDKAGAMRAIMIAGIVRRVLTLEAAETQGHVSVVGAAGRVADKLHLHLSKRIGQERFRTLLARALTLTTAQFPHLSAVQITENGSLLGLHGVTGTDSPERQDNVTPQDRVEAAVALIAHLLELLFTCIGEDLTLRILCTVTPGLDLNELERAEQGYSQRGEAAARG